MYNYTNNEKENICITLYLCLQFVYVLKMATNKYLLSRECLLFKLVM